MCNKKSLYFVLDQNMKMYRISPVLKEFASQKVLKIRSILLPIAGIIHQKETKFTPKNSNFCIKIDDLIYKKTDNISIFMQ